mmetsp:Transcript_6887/g.22142  ORF Transcript_6887/g.22142 Transcript_6887/m.22142 type:complete len:304 (-) Transcript_6887:338-1249(-)
MLCLSITDHSHLIVDVLLQQVKQLLVFLHDRRQFVDLVAELPPFQRHQVMQEPTVGRTISTLPPLTSWVRTLLHGGCLDNQLKRRRRRRRVPQASRLCGELRETRITLELAECFAQRKPCIWRHQVLHLCLQPRIVEVKHEAIVRAADADLGFTVIKLQQGLARLASGEVQDEVKDCEVICPPGELDLVLVPSCSEGHPCFLQTLFGLLSLLVILGNPLSSSHTGFTQNCKLGSKTRKVVHYLLVRSPVPLLKLLALEHHVVELKPGAVDHVVQDLSGLLHRSLVERWGRVRLATQSYEGCNL